MPRSAPTHRRCTHCLVKCLGCGTEAETNTACTAGAPPPPPPPPCAAVEALELNDEDDEDEEDASKTSSEDALSRPLLQLLPPGGARMTAFPPCIISKRSVRIELKNNEYLRK